MAIAVVGTRRLAFAADSDDGRVHVFDLDARREVSSTPVGGTPAQLVLARGGHVFVALRDRAMVAGFRVVDYEGRLERTITMPTAEEPIALALSSDERTLFVASGWGAELDVFPVGSTSPRARVPLGREPRAVLEAPSVAGAAPAVLVAHAVDEGLSVVTFGERNVEVTRKRERAEKGHAGQGFALARIDRSIFAPQVDADPDTGETYYGAPHMTPFIEVVDIGEPDKAAPAEARSSYVESNRDRLPPVSMPVFRNQGRNRFAVSVPHCLLPRAAAVRDVESGDEQPHLLVACMGDDTLLELMSRRPGPSPLTQRRRELPGGVTGLAYDKATDTAVAWAQHARQLVLVPLSEPLRSDEVERAARVAIDASGDTPLDPELQLGRRIFHAAGDMRLSADGRACASCHPDGRDDGRTWRTPDGWRQTMTLAGRLSDTAPYGWTRHAPSLTAYFNDTISRLRGSGLPPRDASALEKYVLSLRAPSSSSGAARLDADLPLVLRGKSIFESREAACASCHAGPASTDGLEHDVGTAPSDDRLRAFATPSLRFIAKTAPYFHDGRYPTLRALLTAPDSKMGSTKHLAGADLDALEAYLGTL